jgi:hypothetical protein
MKTVRVFSTKNEDGEELLLEVRRPTQAQLSRGELLSRAKFSEAFRAGVVLNAEAKKILAERDMWGPEQEEEVARMRSEIFELEATLKDPTVSNSDGKDLVEQIRIKRIELDEFQSIVQSISGGTCESVAQEEKNMFFAAECVFNKTTGQKVYKNLEEFKNRLNELSTVEAYAEATIASLEVLIGEDLPSDLSTRYTENMWLVERGLDSEEETETEAEVTDEVSEGAPVEEPESAAPVKKKRGRKKKQEATS